MTVTTAPPRPQLLLQGQAAAPDGPVDPVGMYVHHFAFRRDLRAFAAAVRRTPVADRAAWRLLAERWDLFAGILHHHHEAEDRALWPELLRRADAAGDTQARALLEAMEAEHGDIDPALTACGEGFARLAEHADEDARAALDVRVVALREGLDRHLAHEERDAMALIQRLMSDEEWRRMEREEFKPMLSLGQLLVAIAWSLHGLTPAEVRRVTGAGPLFVAVWKIALKRRFERREATVFRYAREG